MNYKFSDYKDKISIFDAASKIGYKIDRSGGVSNQYLEMSKGEPGKLTDVIVVHYPNDCFRQEFFSRNGIGDSGDLIVFVANRLDKFNAKMKGWDGVNEVLSAFMGEKYTKSRDENIVKKEDVKSFDISEFDVKMATIADLEVLSYRGLNNDILKIFLPHINIVCDLLSTYKMQNIGFPYYDVPQGNKIINFELRNKIINKIYKGHCRNGEKSKGVWSVTWNADPRKVKRCFFFESAIDGMSFVQLNFKNLNLEEISINSLGGQVSEMQIKKTCAHYYNAEVYNCYDNDVMGHVFELQTNAIIQGINCDFQNRTITKQVFSKYNGQTIEWDYAGFNVLEFCRRTGFQLVCHSNKVAAPYKDYNEVLQKMKEK